MPFFQISLKNVNSKPPLSRLSRAFYPTTFLEIAAYFSEFIGICLKNIMLIKYSTKNSKVESLNNKTNLINFRYFPSKALNNINRTIQSVFFVPS